MATISVSHDIKKLKRDVTGIFRDQIPYASSVAVNETLKASQRQMRKQLPRYLDRPTPFTLGKPGNRGAIRGGSFWLQFSNKRNLTGAIFLGAKQAEYMGYAIAGGNRTPDRRAIRMPVNINLNAYGNIPRTRINTLLRRKDVFSGTVKGVEGIWQRNKRGGVTLLVAWEKKASYRKRLPYYKIVHGTIHSTINKELDKALTRAIQTRRTR